MCDFMEKLACRLNKVIIAGDFNFSSMRWHNTHTANDPPDERTLRHLLTEHNLFRFVTQPIRNTAVLDLVFLSQSLNNSDVEQLP